MTMPPGAACFMATMYVLMRGLSLPWQSRRTTRAERLDFKCLCELLQRNLDRGFFSFDQFGEAPVVDTDASKSRAYTGGGYASRCGRYRFFRYGAAAQHHKYDRLPGGRRRGGGCARFGPSLASQGCHISHQQQRIPEVGGEGLEPSREVDSSVAAAL